MLDWVFGSVVILVKMKINEKNLCYFATSPPVDREGWLQKRGDLNKSWQRRYFVLKGNLLFYFEKKGDREPLGVIILEGCTIGEWQSNCMLARIVEQMLLICRFDFRIGRRGRAVLFPNCISWHQQSNIFPQCRITRDVSTRVLWVIQFRVWNYKCIINWQNGAMDESAHLCRLRIHEIDGCRTAKAVGRNRSV